MLELEIGEQLTIPPSQFRGTNSMGPGNYTKFWEMLLELSMASATTMIKDTNVVGDKDSLLEKITHGESFDWRPCTAIVVQRFGSRYFAVRKDGSRGSTPLSPQPKSAIIC